MSKKRSERSERTKRTGPSGPKGPSKISKSNRPVKQTSRDKTKETWSKLIKRSDSRELMRKYWYSKDNCIEKVLKIRDKLK